MKLIIISTGWNIQDYIIDYINSIKSQTYKDFIVYLIDDVSTDNTYQIGQKYIGDDSRFILIKNTEKKWKTKNFIDVINNNSPIIKPEDVIIEIDPDDMLANEHVLMKIYNIYSSNPNIWITDSKWQYFSGKPGKYGKVIPELIRTGYTVFSHLRTFRVFLFKAIREEDLMFEGEYFKAGCDIAYGIPMLEMAGSEHYHYLNQVLYNYRIHDKQTQTINSSHQNKDLQLKSTIYVLGLPYYKKLIIEPNCNLDNIKGSVELNPWAFYNIITKLIVKFSFIFIIYKKLIKN